MRRAPEEPADEAPVAVIRQRFLRETRVRRHAEYRVIQARGRRVHSAHYVWIVMPRPAPSDVLSRPSAPSDVLSRPAPSDVPSDRASAPIPRHVAPVPEIARLGLTMTKKSMPHAVARNRAKRVLREVFRKERALFPAGCDVVVVGKAGAELLGYAETLAELRSITTKLLAAGRSAASRGGDGPRRHA